MFWRLDPQEVMQKRIFELRTLSKRNNRLSQQEKIESEKSKQLCLKFMQQNDMERSAMYANKAVLQNRASLQYLDVALQLDLIATQLRRAESTLDLLDGVQALTRAISCIQSPDVMKAKIQKFETDFESFTSTTKLLSSSVDGLHVMNKVSVDSNEKAANEILSWARDTAKLQHSQTLPEMFIPSSANQVSDNIYRNAVALHK